MPNSSLKKISDETKKRCKILHLDNKLAKSFLPISLELFHFFYEMEKVTFSIYFRFDHYIIEFIKPEEFSKELLDHLWKSLLKPAQNVEFCIRKADQLQLSAAFDQVRQAKIKRLIQANPKLDTKALELFNSLSQVSQMVVRGGMSPTVVSSVGQSAEYLVDNLVKTEQVVTSISRMITIDPTLYDHSATVAMFAAILASRVTTPKLSKKEVKIAAQCALFHDLGKTCVPSAILNKPGKFTAEEWEIMKTHAAAGEKEIEQLIKKGMDIDPLVARAAGEHHENFCGDGYPRGRKGRYEENQDEGIHLMTRIVSIADVYSALLMKRVYKESYDPVEALTVMNDCAIKFDPVLFEIFLTEVTNGLNEEARGSNNHGRILSVEGGKLRVIR